MFPAFTIHYEPDSASGDAVFAGKCGYRGCARAPFIANRANRVSCEFGSVAFLAMLRCFGVSFHSVLFTHRGAALASAVFDVVKMGSKEEMSWIAAGRIVAAMANKARAGVFAVMNEVAHSVGAIGKLFQCDHSVAIPITEGYPRPALIKCGDANFIPKALDFLRSESRQFTMWLSHNLKVPFSLWLEPLVVLSARQRLAYFTTPHAY